MKKDPQIPALRRLSIDKAGELALEIEGVGYRPVGWSGRAPARAAIDVGAQAYSRDHTTLVRYGSKASPAEPRLPLFAVNDYYCAATQYVARGQPFPAATRYIAIRSPRWRDPTEQSERQGQATWRS
jgi:hypothetical protein